MNAWPRPSKRARFMMFEAGLDLRVARRAARPAFASRTLSVAVLALALTGFGLIRANAAGTTIVGWSDEGLHETDETGSGVYSLFPPYSTIHAQFISAGKLVTSTNGIRVTYEAVADATGSINTTSQGKTRFFEQAPAVYGVTLAPDQGLAGFAMPGPANQPQAMRFEPANRRFTAAGIPLTPIDDQGRTNPFPMMRLVVRNSAGAELAHTDIALPVSDQMDCRTCHASGSQVEARPQTGWVWDCDPVRDYRLNILRYHDDARGWAASYRDVLREVGYNPDGLVATVLQDGHPVLCARCHASAALPGSGATAMRPLSRLIHAKHAKVLDPASGMALDDLGRSAACLRCHAGPESLYQRGVHQAVLAADGSPGMTCQSCHGTMSDVGNLARQAWLDEPACQNCHTGTATSNNGRIRYASVFESGGAIREAVNPTFATQPNSPAAGLSLYHASRGHGGLYCAACHGAPHAELTSRAANENVQSQQRQGHAGALLDCGACHPTTPNTLDGGPHGMHPVGQSWASRHEAEGTGSAQCRSCHGPDYRGSVLSRMQASRTFNAIVNRLYWQGFQTGCYNCHPGPGGEGGSGNRAPLVSNGSATAVAGSPVAIPLRATDADHNALTLRLVSQPAHGTATLSGANATYVADAGFAGSDALTFAAWDGSVDSNLGTLALTVTPGPCALTVTGAAPTAALPGAAVAFRGEAVLSGCSDAILYDWDFGDGTPHGTGTTLCHTYPTAGDFTWTLTATGGGMNRTATGVVTISPTLGPPLPMTVTSAFGLLTLSWPIDRVPAVLESTYDPTSPAPWAPIYDPPVVENGVASVQVYITSDQEYFRLRRVP